MWTGSNSDSDFKLCPEKNFKWPRKKVKTLGVWLSIDPDLTVSLNYKDKLDKIKAILECWKLRRLSLLGKIMVLKSLVVSQLLKGILKWKTREGGKLFLILNLGKNGGMAIFTGNLNKKDTNAIKISDPFIKEVLEIWSEVNFEQAAVTEDHFF